MLLVALPVDLGFAPGEVAAMTDVTDRPAPFMTRSFVIEWGQCDPAGIVFAPRYLDMFSESTIRVFEHAGLPPKKRMLAERGVAGYPMVDLACKFMIPCSYGDEVAVESEAPVFGNSSFSITHRVVKNGRTCVEGTEKRVWAVPDPDKPGAIKGARVPDDIRALFLR